MPPLVNPRHEAVAQALAAGLDPAASAAATGYPPRSLTRIAARADVRDRVGALTGEPPVDRRWVVAQLRAVFERAMRSARPGGSEKPVVASGKEAVALKALELLGKELGMFGAKRGVDADDILKLSDSEIETLIDALGGAEPAPRRLK